MDHRRAAAGCPRAPPRRHPRLPWGRALSPDLHTESHSPLPPPSLRHHRGGDACRGRCGSSVGSRRGRRGKGRAPPGRPRRCPCPARPHCPAAPGHREHPLRLWAAPAAPARALPKDAPLLPRPLRGLACRRKTSHQRGREVVRVREKIIPEVGKESVVKVATVYLLAKNIYFLVQFGSHICTFLPYVQKQTTTTKKSKHLILTGLPKTSQTLLIQMIIQKRVFFFFLFSFNIQTCLQVVTIQRFLFTIITTTIKN